MSIDKIVRGALDPLMFVKEGEVATWTTAQAEYDWFATREICVVGTASNGKTIRMVAGPGNRVEFQRARYMSGNHMAVDEVEWNKLVAYKLVKLQ